MVRLLVSALLHTIANAVGLLVASALLEDFTMTTQGFLFATLLFTTVEVVGGPLILKIALTNIRALTGGIALVTTLVGLIITDIFVEGFDISGVSTWIGATVIIWFAALLAGLILPLIVFKKVMSSDSK